MRSPFTIFEEYRRRFGIAKLKTAYPTELCAHLSLYLKNIGGFGIAKLKTAYPTELCAHLSLYLKNIGGGSA